MDESVFMREAELVGVPEERAREFYRRLYPPHEAVVPAARPERPGRLMLAVIWFAVALIVAASVWWAALLDAPSDGAVALLAVWGAGFAVAAELMFRRGQLQLCGGIAVVALGYVPAVTLMMLDTGESELDSFSDPSRSCSRPSVSFSRSPCCGATGGRCSRFPPP